MQDPIIDFLNKHILPNKFINHIVSLKLSDKNRTWAANTAENVLPEPPLPKKVTNFVSLLLFCVGEFWAILMVINFLVGVCGMSVLLKLE